MPHIVNQGEWTTDDKMKDIAVCVLSVSLRSTLKILYLHTERNPMVLSQISSTVIKPTFPKHFLGYRDCENQKDEDKNVRFSQLKLVWSQSENFRVLDLQYLNS